ncbi:MAG: lamin tail domain-containing protein [bacterium]|nr:lamin tail domain-containing protein [bacterium]
MRIKYLFLIVPFLFFVRLVHAAPATHVVISEIKISGPSGFSTDEFVELYNPTDSPVDITGWQLVKRTVSGATYPLVDSIEALTIAAHGYMLIAHPTGYTGVIVPDARYSTTNSLSPDNSLELVSSAGIVDLVGWGKVTHFEGAVALTPGSAKSIERKALSSSTLVDLVDGGADVFRGNGEDTDHNDADFVSRDVPDPQASTSELEFITAAAPAPKATNTNQPATSPTVTPTPTVPIITQPVPHTVMLSEILPDPKGPDTTAEFIELVNTGDIPVDLTNWKLADTSKTSYTIPKGIIVPGGWFVVKRGESGIALNNTGGESVTLTAADGVVTSTVLWQGSAPEAQSYSLVKGAWVWTGKLTSGSANEYLDPNHAPIAAIRDVETSLRIRETATLSAADSSDPDGDDLEFRWSFSDGGSATGTSVKHTFIKAGSIIVTLTATDSKGKFSTDKVIFSVKDFQRSTLVIISSLVPNPAEGEDEWVEIANTGKTSIDLAGWLLQSGKKAQKLEGILNAGATRRLTSEDLNFALRNAGGTIVLLDPDGKSMSTVTYATTTRGIVVRRHADGTYGADVQAATAVPSGQVAGDAVVVQPAVQASNKQTSAAPAATSFPTWAWAVIAGGAVVVWAGYEVWHRRRTKLGSRPGKDAV